MPPSCNTCLAIWSISRCSYWSPSCASSALRNFPFCSAGRTLVGTGPPLAFSEPRTLAVPQAVTRFYRKLDVRASSSPLCFCNVRSSSSGFGAFGIRTPPSQGKTTRFRTNQNVGAELFCFFGFCVLVLFFVLWNAGPVFFFCSRPNQKCFRLWRSPKVTDFREDLPSKKIKSDTRKRPT